MDSWHNLYVTDKSGKKMWNTTASPMSTMSEIRNLKQHLESAVKHPDKYPMLDVATAVIMLDGAPYQEPTEAEIDEILEALFV